MAGEQTTAVVRLPVARIEQLKNIAYARRTTLVAVIESFIGEAIKRGEISNELPGFSLEPQDNSQKPFKLSIGDLEPLNMTNSDVLALSDALKGMNLGAIEAVKGMNLSLARVGRAVVLKARDQQVAMTDSIARDLATQLRSSVTSAITIEDVPSIVKT